MIDLYYLSDIVRDKRKEKGWTQIELAEFSGVSRNFIRKIESGSFADISFVKLCRVLDMLGLTIEVLDKKEIKELKKYSSSDKTRKFLSNILNGKKKKIKIGI